MPACNQPEAADLGAYCAKADGARARTVARESLRELSTTTFTRAGRDWPEPLAEVFGDERRESSMRSLTAFSDVGRTGDDLARPPADSPLDERGRVLRGRPLESHVLGLALARSRSRFIMTPISTARSSC
jgi:hypothetical protein